MAWTAPLTAVAGAAFTVSQFNASVRDNLLETAPAKATTAGGYFVGTGANAIAQRTLSSSTVLTSETSTSTSFVNLATVGPSVTVTTGDRALVSISCQLENSTTSQVLVALEVSGATSITADYPYAITVSQSTAADASAMGQTFVVPLTAGSNTFTMKYRVSGGTGAWRRRKLVVMPF